MDDITWLAEYDNINEVVQTLERCAAASLRWADSHAVCFKTTRTEATPFSRRRKHWRARGEKTIHVGDQMVRSARDATRWPGVWLDSAPTHRKRCVSRT